MQINRTSANAANQTQSENSADLANLTAQSTIYSASVGGKTYTAISPSSMDNTSLTCPASPASRQAVTALYSQKPTSKPGSTSRPEHQKEKAGDFAPAYHPV